MINIEELKNMWIYNRKVHLPINFKSKYKGSVIFLLTPNILSSINMINHPLLINRYHSGYYIEKDIMYFINNENNIVGNVNDLKIISENGEYRYSEDSVLNEISGLSIDEMRVKSNDYTLGENSLITNIDNKTLMLLFNDSLDDEVLTEGSNKHNYILRKLLYEERLRRHKEIFAIHDKIKKSCPTISKTYINYTRYKKFNLFVDFYYYNEVFFKNNMFRLNKGLNLYLDLMTRYLNDKRLSSNGYNKKTIFVPVHDWKKYIGDSRITRYNENINPISIIYRLMLKDLDRLKNELGHIPFVFFGEHGFFKVDFSTIIKRDVPRFLNYINRLQEYKEDTPEDPGIDEVDDKEEELDNKQSYPVIKPTKNTINNKRSNIPSSKDKPNILDKKIDIYKIPDEKQKPSDRLNKKDINKDIYVSSSIRKNNTYNNRPNKSKEFKRDRIETANSILINVVDKIERNSSIRINNLTGKGDTKKDELVKRINNAAVSSKDTNETINKLNDDVEVKRIIADLSNQEDDDNKLTTSRVKRISKLKDDFLKLEIDNKTIDEILNKTKDSDPIPSTKLDIDTINEEWGSLKSINFEEIYDVEEDMLKIIDDLSSEVKSKPISVVNISKEDTSTSEDLVSTYTYNMEDSNGKRFKVVLDIPEFEDNKYLILKGNKKVLNRQLMLLPVVKTDRDTVQVVTNYNKLILTRFGSRSYIVSDKLVKMINKFDDIVSIKVNNGDCTRSNSNYNLPIDYMELSSNFTSIDTKDYLFLFNQKEIREKYKDIFKEKQDSFPIGYNKKDKSIIYCKYNDIYSIILRDLLLSQNNKIQEIYDKVNPARKYTYTRISILNRKLPLILVLAYSEGLFNVMNKARIKYDIYDNRVNRSDDRDVIRFKDGYVAYENTYESSLLMNGIKECNTEDYSITEVNNKSMYMNFLDNFGGRIVADGLENFYECMIDPITREILVKYNMPTDYVELLLYANDMLADTKFTKHVDMSGVRYRSNEIVAACIYKVISSAYGDYKNELKRNRRNVKLNVKRTAVIDELLKLNILSDVSDLSPILEVETLHTVSTKGPSGMNAERAYSLDKRAYHPSMINILGMSTPQGIGVGINRQTTIDMNIEGKRGYIKIDNDVDNFNVTKTLTVTEAMSPFSVTRDDPPRTSMNLSQAKHTMQVKESDPLLITNGVEEAIPYMISNTFVHKSKKDGTIIEITDDYMILEYKDKTKEFVDLRSKTLKNSGGGFYTSIKLDTDYKKGQRVKKNDIVAYDKQFFSDKVGYNKNIACNSGTFVKIAILNTDDGFEDSAIISEKVSSKMASDVIIKKDVYLGKNANIFNMVKKGQKVQDGDSLLIFQNSYEEEDVNMLLRNLVDDKEIISEIGRNDIKSKYTGTIEDIKVYRTVEKNELSPSLLKKVNEIEKYTRDIKNVMKKYNVDYYNRFSESDTILDQTGKLKKIKDGVLFEFYIKYEDKMSIGDKLTFFIALKGVIKDIFPEGYEPYTDFRKEEKIDALLATGSVAARMTCSIKINMLINKILVELSRSVKDILKIPYDVDY